MRRKVLAGLGSAMLAIAAPAIARGEEPVIAQWGGFYGGAHVGYSWGTPSASADGEVEKLYDLVPDVGTRKAVDAEVEGAQVPLSFDGAAGGFHIGYNQQFRHFIIGVEGDYDWTEGENSAGIAPEAKLTNPTGAAAIANGTTSVGNEAEIKYRGSMGDIASLRGRVGFSNTSLLVYGTGGVAWTDYALDITAQAVEGYENGAFHMSKNLTGWVAGGGVEYKLSRNLSLRAEVLHYDFGSMSYAIGDEGAFEELAGKHDINFNEARVGASYHLN
jgi:outer membrane immunogenic protein